MRRGAIRDLGRLGFGLNRLLELPDGRIVCVTCHPQKLLAGGTGGQAEALAMATAMDGLVAVTRKALGLPHASVSLVREVQMKAVLGPGLFGGGGTGGRAASLLDALQMMRGREYDDRCRDAFLLWPPGLLTWALGRGLSAEEVLEWDPKKGERGGFPTASGLFLSEQGEQRGPPPAHRGKRQKEQGSAGTPRRPSAVRAPPSRLRARTDPLFPVPSRSDPLFFFLVRRRIGRQRGGRAPERHARARAGARRADAAPRGQER